MNNRETLRYKQRLDKLFEKAKNLADDPELQSHWTRYLCVLVAGFLETSVRLTLMEYARSRAQTNVSNYVTAQLNGFRSPSMGNILKTAGLFSKEWAEQLERDTEGELRDSIDSIVAHRHLIAHGRDTGISYVQLQRFYENAVKVVELLETKCQ